MRADTGHRFSRKACYADRKFVAAFTKKHLSLNIVFRVQTVEGNKPHSVNLGNVIGKPLDDYDEKNDFNNFRFASFNFRTLHDLYDFGLFL